MLKIVQSIYDMTGEMVKLPPDEDTAEKRVNKIFALMDLNKDHQRASSFSFSPHSLPLLILLYPQSPSRSSRKARRRTRPSFKPSPSTTVSSNPSPPTSPTKHRRAVSSYIAL